MGVTNQPWDGSPTNYKDTDAFCAACLIDTNPAGQQKIQALCKLPIYEPNGDLNTNALGPAAGALNGARGGLKGVSPAVKKAAARKLLKAYQQAKMGVPVAIKNMAQ